MLSSIYHITDIRNLPGIIEQGGLWCDREVHSRNCFRANAGHAHIKGRRARTRVPVAARGFVGDYVPFYFAPRSPMLFAIHKGNVAGYTGSQRNIIHLVTSAERVVAQQLPFAFTDGHAIMNITRYFDDLADLHNVDWQIMGELYWADTPEDGDRERRRNAEFLVRNFAPWSLIEQIGVMDQQVAHDVRVCLAGVRHQPRVAVRSGWYYW